HHARAREDAVTVGTPHRLVHVRAEAEVIGRHDESLHTSIMALPRKLNTRPLQYTFRPIRLASHTNKATVSRSGSSHDRRMPSRSRASRAAPTGVPPRAASGTATTSHDLGPPQTA